MIQWQFNESNMSIHAIVFLRQDCDHAWQDCCYVAKQEDRVYVDLAGTGLHNLATM